MNRARRTVALALLGALALLAVAGPWLGPVLVGFAPDEQHTAFPYASPGFADVPEAHPSFDGRPEAFALLDPAGSGRVACSAAACPALEPVAAAARALSRVLAQAWQDGGADAVVATPALDAALAPWPAWRTAVRGACPGATCPLPEVLDASRFLRLTPAALASMDADGDGAVTQAEFLGAPVARPHLLGSDGLGRDAFVRLLAGLRLSLTVGALAALAAAAIGVAWGATAGVAGGWTGAAMMRVVDVLYGLPYVFLVILLISLVGPSTFNLLIAIACVQWLGMARTVRGLVATLRTAPWAEMARIQGCGPVRLAVTHLIPNARRPILAWTTLLVPASIKDEAFLSFLGLGIQAPAASLGTLIADGAPRLAEYPWLVAAPAAVLFLLVLLVHEAQV